MSFLCTDSMEHQSESRYVLLVEDDEDISSLLSGLLKKYGYDVISAHSGEDALRLFKEKCFDIIILDVHLPSLDGDTVVRFMKQQQPSQKMIVISGDFNAAQAIGVKYGIDEVFEKPFHIRDLNATIQRLMTV